MSPLASPTESGEPPAVRVPVVADSLSREARNDLARCVYFTITADDPGTNWTLCVGSA